MVSGEQSKVGETRGKSDEGGKQGGSLCQQGEKTRKKVSKRRKHRDVRRHQRKGKGLNCHLRGLEFRKQGRAKKKKRKRGDRSGVLTKEVIPKHLHSS